MKIHNLEQGSPEWFEVRKLKLTASNADAIATSGKGLDTLVDELVAEYFATTPEEPYINADMERGNLLEAEARNMYSSISGNVIEQVGFVELDEHVGCSPDGLVNDDGLVEIKCPNNKNYIKLMLTEKIDTKYIWQMQMQMFVTGRKWCDFVAYNPNYSKYILIIRVNADLESQEKIQRGLEKGKAQIKEMVAKLKDKMQ